MIGICVKHPLQIIQQNRGLGTKLLAQMFPIKNLQVPSTASFNCTSLSNFYLILVEGKISSKRMEMKSLKRSRALIHEAVQYSFCYLTVPTGAPSHSL